MQTTPEGTQAKTKDSNLGVVNRPKSVSLVPVLVLLATFLILVKHSRGRTSRQHLRLASA